MLRPRRQHFIGTRAIQKLTKRRRAAALQSLTAFETSSSDVSETWRDNYELPYVKSVGVSVSSG